MRTLFTFEDFISSGEELSMTLRLFFLVFLFFVFVLFVVVVVFFLFLLREDVSIFILLISPCKCPAWHSPTCIYQAARKLCMCALFLAQRTFNVSTMSCM